MDSVVFALRLGFLALACVELIKVLCAPHKRMLHVWWGVFCASISLMLVRDLAGEAAGAYAHLMGIGACATCNAHWLAIRASFRPEAPLTRWHFSLAGSVAVLVVCRESMLLLADHGFVGPATVAVLRTGLNDTLTLLSSTVLMLTFREATVGWATASHGDRRRRVTFCGAFGTAVFLCTVVPGAVHIVNDESVLLELLGVCAGLIAVTTSAVLVASAKRRLSADSQEVPTPPEEFSLEERRLARDVDHLVQRTHLYLRADLKVADVADALGVPAYRVSRAVTGPLQERNFNRYVNRYRVEHAKGMLMERSTARSILNVGLDSGFASIGPFNRAFKELTGTTPSAYRTDAAFSLEANADARSL
ncbi:MAG: helix-turn-helix transcriptional regulator [Pseudomonadota bacterium]